MLRIFMFLKKKEKRLGVAEGNRHYALPLSHDASAKFLCFIAGLMTFLALLALYGSVGLHNVVKHWSAGLQGQATVEIPAKTAKGTIREPAEIQDLAIKVSAALQKQTEITSTHILEIHEIKDLLAPWLGDDLSLTDMPLPSLIAIELNSRNPEVLSRIRENLTAIQPEIHLDTHEEWLDDILSAMTTLQTSGFLIALLIALATLAAVSMGMRARMEMLKPDIELLHLMGAGDIYIARQFQRHAFTLALKGCLTGAGLGALFLIALRVFTPSAAASLPSFNLNIEQILWLISLPFILALCSLITARFTVLRALSEMP